MTLFFLFLTLHKIFLQYVYIKYIYKFVHIYQPFGEINNVNDKRVFPGRNKNKLKDDVLTNQNAYFFFPFSCRKLSKVKHFFMLELKQESVSSVSNGTLS